MLKSQTREYTKLSLLTIHCRDLMNVKNKSHIFKRCETYTTHRPVDLLCFLKKGISIKENKRPAYKFQVQSSGVHTLLHIITTAVCELL